MTMKEMNTPLVSVIMGAYNCGSTIGEAIESIQGQTYANWELIICDDGSKDNTVAVVNTYADSDSRIRLISNSTNLGLNKTLNHCLEESRGEYIARMDGDDLCDPSRFEKQVSFLNEHAEYALCGTIMKLFDQSGVWGEKSVPEYPTREQVVSGNPISHATVMMRKSALDAVNGYTEDDRMLRVEDVNLWIKLYAEGYRAYNLQEALYSMRNDQNAVNRRKYRYRINSVYVRLQGCRMMKLGPVSYLKALKPMAVGLVPGRLRQLYRRKAGYGN